MTIARRRGLTVEPIAAPSPAPATPSGRRVGMQVPLGDVPAPDVATPVGRLRRCTFRRIDPVTPLPGRPRESGYEVMCLYGGVDEPLALGDLDAARSICNRCRAIGIFRPDEA